MKFSEFAQTMYTYCNNGETKSEFVIHLVNKIMGGQPGRMHEDGTYQNPLGGGEPRTLLSYFNGERSIPQDAASIILSSMDKEKFEKYIEGRCSGDAQIALIDDLSVIETISGNKRVPEVCAELFEQILHDLADGKKKSTNKPQ